MNKCVERLYNGIIKENPTFVLMLGMCPTLAVTTTAINGVGMGLSTTAVLVFSNLIISALRKIIPDRVRIPAYIVVVASLVTIVQLLLQAYVKTLYDSLGIFIPLIVVNCIILGRAEAYAAKNPPLESAFDGIGMGLGFTVGLTCIAVFREILGSGAIFGVEFIPEDYRIAIFGLAPGAFFVLACLTALQNKFKAPSATNGSVPQSELACGGNCLTCHGSACAANHEMLEEIRRKAEEEAAAAKKAAAEKAAAAKK
ncbi:MAG: electron transport complex subunit E, partial [Eubacteriales bacterium]|nr:electron transport complex subunit E [Eubacteriales bacterium]